jgi:hypothetical protein
MTTRRSFAAIPLVFLGWVTVLLTVTLVSDEAPAVVVLFPSAAFAKNLPDDVSVTGWTTYTVTLVSERPSLAATLYASGARIVLPSGLLGCGN